MKRSLGSLSASWEQDKELNGFSNAFERKHPDQHAPLLALCKSSTLALISCSVSGGARSGVDAGFGCVGGIDDTWGPPVSVAMNVQEHSPVDRRIETSAPFGLVAICGPVAD